MGKRKTTKAKVKPARPVRGKLLTGYAVNDGGRFLTYDCDRCDFKSPSQSETAEHARTKHPWPYVEVPAAPAVEDDKTDGAAGSGEE